VYFSEFLGDVIRQEGQPVFEVADVPAGASKLAELGEVDAVDADEVVTAVLTASRLLIAVSARSLAAVEETLTLPQFRMLVILDSRGAMMLSRLAQHLTVTPSTAYRMADRLIGLGMVARGGNASDRRQVTLGLTDLGRRTVREATARRRSDIARIVAKLPPGDRTALIQALRAFSHAGGEPTAASAGPAW
jgi:DNA-binding MarR family transcriptional regulator